MRVQCERARLIVCVCVCVHVCVRECARVCTYVISINLQSNLSTFGTQRSTGEMNHPSTVCLCRDRIDRL